MALSFHEARWYVKVNGKDIGKLAKRGDKLALGVVGWYSKVFEESRGRSINNNTRESFRKSVEEYAQRDLTAHERAELAGKKGHLIGADEDAVDKRHTPSNIIDLSVRRALRSH